MKLISVDEIQQGMVLAQNVYTLDDQLVLPKGTMLDPKAIRRLHNYNIFNVFINDDDAKEKTIKSSKKESFGKRLKESREFQDFKRALEKDAKLLETALKKTFTSDEAIKSQSLAAPVLSLFDQNETGAGIMDMIHNLRGYDDAIYMHSISVALISNMIARWMRKSDEEIKMITTAGLVHDIGKIIIPQSILTKTSSLTPRENETLKTHTRLGYQLLKDKDIDPHIKNAVLMHHERNDGSGYPLGLMGEKIVPVARIIAVADIYDDLTSKRANHEPVSPFKVIEAFEADGLIKYDADVILTFLNHIANTFLANKVRLSNNLEGEVIYINPEYLARPTVKCGDSFIDLSRRKDIYITAII
ncbi:HD-GYP domain-containing protein [Butyrivibrio sp. AC2005]|uniref:HD-GYP domain-containing protein n=1 Tax=Butyrivibrio sp. AC2005 TaxID=1280672 RepID=UPI000423F2FF|nr:HD domain-containing phosphohydrolase [Butyrivibrio sp. AC2005]